MSVYFAHCPVAGLVKIGRSKSPAKRLAQLSRETRSPMSLLAMIDGDSGVENRVHRILDGHVSHGEWFHESPAVMAFAARAASGDDWDIIGPLAPFSTRRERGHRSIATRRENRRSKAALA